MPPKKRKVNSSTTGAGNKRAKKGQQEPSDAPSSVSDAIQKLKEADKNKVRKCKPDALCPLSAQCTVHEDYDCMLNQTNIGRNNNKYYIIQVLKDKNGKYFSWNRWGRVGEPGQNALKAHNTSVESAIADFKKKFKDKTRNDWDSRDNFKPVHGKYTLLEMDDDDDDGDNSKVEKVVRSVGAHKGDEETLPCSLDASTAALMKLLFDNDMFKDAMKDMDIDVKKMPLGKLSKTQIAKGFEVLEEIEDAIKNKTTKSLDQLSSRFYTLIPHDFGRQRPPIISTEEAVRKKMDMLLVLADIELAQAMQKTKETSQTKDAVKEPHPLDVKYQLLQADLTLLDKKNKEFKVIEKYLSATCWSHKKPQILDVWKVNRHNEADRFKAYDEIDNRKLLWHGTNVAVVAAILKSGLRIMPHSGGRVGKGIYFASENAKSASYVRCAAGHTGIMFLNEVALGKEKHITQDDWKITAPPAGYDSIIAKGRTEPDPKQDTTIDIEGHKVTVPQGKPIPVPEYKDSFFSQSEYLIYKESQNRIRYLLKLKM